MGDSAIGMNGRLDDDNDLVSLEVRFSNNSYVLLFEEKEESR
jgi:hypothetical protein